MHAKSFFSTTILLSALLTGSTAWANACSKADIDFYLQRGFSHEQVVRLCSNAPVMMQNSAPSPGSSVPKNTQQATPAPASTQAKPAPAVTTIAPPVETTAPAITTPKPAGNVVSRGDLIYFKTAIKSDQVDLTPDTLSYLLGGCIKYGEADFNGFKEEACVNTRTTIQRKGLQVIKAQKGILLIRDQKLIVAGDIQREVLNIDKLKAKKREAFLAEYDLNPEQLNIPVRSGIDPRDVAARLQLIAK